MCSGWSLHPVLFLACVQADPYTLYCSLHVFRLILTPCTVPCMCSGWSLHPVLFLACVQADPYTLYCSLYVFRLILTPCTVPCRCTGWFTLGSCGWSSSLRRWDGWTRLSGQISLSESPRSTTEDRSTRVSDATWCYVMVYSNTELERDLRVAVATAFLPEVLPS